VSWDAIADVKKRTLQLEKRDLVCTSAEECLSFKGDVFCYDKRYVSSFGERGQRGVLGKMGSGRGNGWGK
jgi:hypothetical protein